MRYLFFDAETANPDYSSICQIGIATFEHGAVVDTGSTLFNPETNFYPSNTDIPEIREDDV